MGERRTAALEQYLTRLRRARTEAAYLGIEDGLEGVMRLADLQSAIQAVEAVIAGGESEPAESQELADILVRRGEIEHPRVGFAPADRRV